MGGLVHRREIGEQRPHRLRLGHQLDGYVQSEPEASLGPDECSAQIVAISLTDLAAELDHLAAWQNHRHRQHVVERDPVLEAMRTSGVLGYVAADRARRLARRIRSVEQSVRCDVLVEPEIHDAGLDRGAAVFDVEREDLLEAVEPDDDDVVGERSAGQSGAGASRDEWESFIGQQSHDCDGLFTRPRKNSEPGLAPVAGQSIGVVDQQLARPTQHVALAHDFGQLLSDPGPHRRGGSPSRGGSRLGHPWNLAIHLRLAGRRRGGARHAQSCNREESAFP